jgi:hypothetical protein
MTSLTGQRNKSLVNAVRSSVAGPKGLTLVARRDSSHNNERQRNLRPWFLFFTHNIFSLLSSKDSKTAAIGPCRAFPPQLGQNKKDF